MIRTGKARERFVSRMCPLCSTDECSGVELQRTVWGGLVRVLYLQRTIVKVDVDDEWRWG